MAGPCPAHAEGERAIHSANPGVRPFGAATSRVEKADRRSANHEDRNQMKASEPRAFRCFRSQTARASSGPERTAIALPMSLRAQLVTVYGPRPCCRVAGAWWSILPARSEEDNRAPQQPERCLSDVLRWAATSEPGTAAEALCRVIALSTQQDERSRTNSTPSFPTSRTN